MILSKKTMAAKLAECGVNKKQATTLIRDYELSLAPLFLQAAARHGKITLPPEEEDRRYAWPTPESALDAERILLPLIKVIDGKLVADPSSLPGGFVDRWEKLAELGAKMPPTVWTRHLKLSPEQLLALQCDDMTQKYFKESWRTAAIRYRDEGWASALTKNAFFYDGAHRLINRFPLDTRERLAQEMIAFNGGTWRLSGAKDSNGQVMMNTMRLLAWDWSEQFSGALLDNLQTEVDKPLPYISDGTLEMAAIYFPISLQSKFPGFQKYNEVLKLKHDLYSLLT